MEGKQITMLDDIDRLDETHYRMKVAEIRGKLETEYRQMKLREEAPDGLVVIEEHTRYLRDNVQRRVFYRLVVGHHMTVGGMMMHLISAPSEEWPDEPSWQPWHGCKWNYPSGPMWTRNEPEYEPEVKWDE